jgi:hypothetical protein
MIVHGNIEHRMFEHKHFVNRVYCTSVQFMEYGDRPLKTLDRLFLIRSWLFKSLIGDSISFLIAV